MEHPLLDSAPSGENRRNGPFRQMKILLAIDPHQPHAAYRDALLAAGALPGEVEIVQPGGVLPEEFDGLLLSGGADVDPSRYGEAEVNGSVRSSLERDRLDFELFSRAERLGVPVFGICRGLQVVNVALGGTLWQDLPSQRPRGVEHSFSTSDGHDPARPAHEIRTARIGPGTLPLSVALAATDGLSVNSRHHQAVKELAPGLVALAVSPDGLVEAFARESGPFLAAVQWHPENLTARADQKALFEAFLAAARPRAASAKSHHETPLGTLDAGEPPSPGIHGLDKEPEPA